MEGDRFGCAGVEGWDVDGVTWPVGMGTGAGSLCCIASDDSFTGDLCYS